MLHTITKILEIWIDINIDINIEISKVDLHTWIFTSRILRVALEVTLLTRIFSYKRLTSCSQKVENLINWEGPNNRAKGGELESLKKISEGTLIRDPRVGVTGKFKTKLKVINPFWRNVNFGLGTEINTPKLGI